ncbi:hypothetical protein TPR58_14310 [Sphingomonas sp. HF-S3]|uniref:Uncharacterized protein n=1 Tax=Sphingomonas rustica TaxID=3103142 RepID=A0ABV0B9U3_9SPHN
MAATSHFSPIRIRDTSLLASGSVYMNERPKLGREQGGLDVHLWVEPARSDSCSFRKPQGVLNFNAEVLIGALDLGMAEVAKKGVEGQCGQ